jgi:hypothetical protein
MKGDKMMKKGIRAEGKGARRFHDNSCQAFSRKSPKGKTVQTVQTSSTT